MREVELHEVQNELKKATEFDLDREFNKIMDPVNDPAAGPPRVIPDYVDTTPASEIPIPPEPPAPADPEPLMVGFGQAEDDATPPLPSPLPSPMPAAQAEPEPARVAEPTKP